MTWPSRRCGLNVLWAALIIWSIAAPPVKAEEDTIQVWLLTYGPGEIYWQRFGHNAIWIRDPASGLDHAFNFGFFDFEQEGFLGNFIFGRLNYFAAARPAQTEIREYIDANRSITAQRLDLDQSQAERLRDLLLQQVSPESREYLYDYYRHNCSTRVRDALDYALDGALLDKFGSGKAPLDYRDHTRRLTAMDPLYYLGLQTGLASPVDRQISRWDETFIPGVLADVVSETDNPLTGKPLVVEEVVLHRSTLPAVDAQARPVWYRYLAVSLLLILAGRVLCRFTSIKARHLVLGWFSLGGLLGGVLVFLWFLTDHWVTAWNYNLLLLNPLWLAVALIPALRRPGAGLVVFFGLVSALAPWLPSGQYNPDVVALVLPLNIAASIALLRNSHQV